MAGSSRTIFDLVADADSEQALPLIEQATADELSAQYPYPSANWQRCGVINVAAVTGQLAVVQALIEKGVNIETETDSTSRPLYNACYGGHLPVVKILISAGASVNQAMNDGVTPLYIASSNGHVEVVARLVAAGADVNQARMNDGVTPLYIASERGHVEVVAQLVTAGADINQAMNNGTTPLYIASYNGNAKVVVQLVAAGADVNQAGNDGWTPLRIASYFGHREVALMLLANGAQATNLAREVATKHPLVLELFSSPLPAGEVEAARAKVQAYRTALEVLRRRFTEEAAAMKKLEEEKARQRDALLAFLSDQMTERQKQVVERSQLFFSIDASISALEDEGVLLQVIRPVYGRFQQLLSITATHQHSLDLQRESQQALLDELLQAADQSEQAVRQSQQDLDVEEIHQLFEQQLQELSRIEQQGNSAEHATAAVEATFVDSLQSATIAIQTALSALQDYDQLYQQQETELRALNLANLQDRYLTALQVAPVLRNTAQTQRAAAATAASAALTTLATTTADLLQANTTARECLAQEIAQLHDLQQVEALMSQHFYAQLGAAQQAAAPRIEEQRRTTLARLRQVVATIGLHLLEVYHYGLAFHREEHTDLAEKMRKARQAKMQARVQQYEEELRNTEEQISAKTKRTQQIRSVLKQLELLPDANPGGHISATSTDMPTQSSLTSSLEDDQADAIWQRVQEKERQMTEAAIAQVQAYEDYAQAVVDIRRANEALTARLSAQQIKLSECLVCPITQEIMMDPVVAADGHTYERRAIEIWLTRSQRSPLTNSPLVNTELQTNWVVRSILSRLREEGDEQASSQPSTSSPTT